MHRTRLFVRLVEMCLIAFAWKTHPDYTLVVGANRDEWHDRAASPAHWWPDHPGILAGRDLQAGGTWLGVAKTGRFAALTNFRDPSERKSAAPSRGQLVSGFLAGAESVVDYLRALQSTAHRYQGFNLLVGDTRSLYYFSSRSGEIREVEPGVHALSNHLLDEPWPKVEKARSALEAVLGAQMPEEARRMAIHAILSDRSAAPDHALPDTGIGVVWERVLSPALIVTEQYGTRCSTVVAVNSTGATRFEEMTRQRDGSAAGVAAFEFMSD